MDDDVANRLIRILEIVNGWLRFAEAKNAVLLAFSGAGITATINYVNVSSNITDLLKNFFSVALIFLCFSSLTCSLSFLPKTNLKDFVWRQSKPNSNLQKLQKDTDNLYFFGDLQKYEGSELLDVMNKFYFKNELTIPYKKEYLDIAQQITINSGITLLKFTIFKVASWFLMSSLIIVVIALGFVLSS